MIFLISLLVLLGLAVHSIGRLLLLAAAECTLEGIPHPTKDDCAREILKWHKRIMDAQQQRRDSEVDEEDDDTKVDQGMRRIDHTLLLHDENDRSNQTALCHTAMQQNADVRKSTKITRLLRLISQKTT